MLRFVRPIFISFEAIVRKLAIFKIPPVKGLVCLMSDSRQSKENDDFAEYIKEIKKRAETQRLSQDELIQLEAYQNSKAKHGRLTSEQFNKALSDLRAESGDSEFRRLMGFDYESYFGSTDDNKDSEIDPALHKLIFKFPPKKKPRNEQDKTDSEISPELLDIFIKKGRQKEPISGAEGDDKLKTAESSPTAGLDKGHESGELKTGSQSVGRTGAKNDQDGSSQQDNERLSSGNGSNVAGGSKESGGGSGENIIYDRGEPSGTRKSETFMGNLTGAGFFWGAVTWFICIGLLANSAACVNRSSCDGGDIMLISVIAVGFLAPAYIVAGIISEFELEK